MTSSLPADVPDDTRIDTDGPVFDAVAQALVDLKPTLDAEGISLNLLEIEDESIAIVELFGKCAGCPMSEMGVRYGVEAHLRQNVPQIMGVDVVADRTKPVRDFREVLERATFTTTADKRTH